MSAGSAAFQAECPQCGKTLKLPASALGKQGRCPGCKTVFQIPGAAEEAAYDPAPGGSPSYGYGAAPTSAPASNGLTPLPGPAAGNASPFAGGPTTSDMANNFGGFGAPVPNMIQNDPWNFSANAAPQGGAWPGAAPGAPMGGWPAPGAPQYGAGAPGAPNGSIANEYLNRAAASHAENRERGGVNMSTLMGGILAMVVAVVWFVIGLAVGIIYFYPPIMFVLGASAVVKALIQGSGTRRA